jgi:hypothetical protein
MGHLVCGCFCPSPHRFNSVVDPVRPRLRLAGAKEPKPWEYALRFVYGGTITVVAGILASAYGPIVGGLFLAFPAILPATMTLLGRHDGRVKAIDEARGARIGSVGMLAFAIAIAELAGRIRPWMVLGMATAAWLVVNLALWFARFGREPQPPDA